MQRSGARRGTENGWGELMARTQAGDQPAYHQLLTEITPYVRSIAAKYHRVAEDVEDTVQDILLSIHAIRQTYDPTRPFAPWLATIAERRALDRLRKRLRNARRETPLEPDHETFAATPANSEGGLEAAELARAMEHLPPGQRQALELLKLKEMSLKEASAATGLSITALKVATHRALKSLRVAMQGKR
jgi:RNA polymerase sigma-70 factor (ECF subfamily)